MKHQIQVALLGVVTAMATSSWACPTFNGTYRCKTQSQDKMISLSTTESAGLTKYVLDGSEIQADGKYRKVRYEGGDYDMAASCKDKTLSLKVKFPGGASGESPACGAQKWDVLYILSWTSQGSDVTEHTSGATLCDDGREVPNDVSDSFNCIKQ